MDWHLALRHDRPAVQALINKMHCAAADFRSVLQCLSLRVESRKRWQQTWMNVEDAAPVRVDEFRRQDAHIPRETNQIDLSRRQRRYYFTIVFWARSSATFDHQRFNSTFSGSFKTDRGGLITDHDRHFGVGNCLVMHSIRQRNHV